MNRRGSTTKTLIIVLVIVLIVLLAATGGGIFYFKSQRKTTEKTDRIVSAIAADLDGYHEALASGDIDMARTYMSETAGTQLGLSSLDVAAYRALILTDLGMSEEDLSDETRSNMDALCESLKGILIQDVTYDKEKLSIEEETDNAYIVSLPVTITGCTSLYALDFSGEIALANLSVSNYTMENAKTLMDFYDTDGIEFVRNNIKKQEVGNLFSAMNGKAAAYEGTPRTFSMTFVVGRDADGNATAATLQEATEIATGEN